MRLRLIAILLVIVLVPLALLGWLGARVARDDAKMIELAFQEAQKEKLQVLARGIGRYIDERKRECLRLTRAADQDTDQLRELIRTQPRIHQLFVLSPEGALRHPDPTEPLNRSERDFLVRAGQWLLDKDLVRAASTEEKPQASLPSQQSMANSEPQRSLPEKQEKASRPSAQQKTAPDTGKAINKTDTLYLQSDSTPKGPNENASFKTTDASYGWFVWFWGKGLNLIFWQRDESGAIVGVELERMRMIADIVAMLPDTGPGQGGTHASPSRVRLLDSNAHVVYQWGAYEPENLKTPFAVETLSFPLNTWHLEYFAPKSALGALTHGGQRLTWIMALTMLAVLLVGLSLYLYREYTRELREASQRVNFVNQVSHELKTPLTNIRMYAELLARDLEVLNEDDAEKPRRHVEVLVAESRRLSRLIGNVLTFARNQRKKLVLRPSPGIVRDSIQTVLENFRPAFAECGITVDMKGEADRVVLFDADVIGQILGNLFSNVEKYASKGQLLRIDCDQDFQRTRIRVTDGGDGIPERFRERIFQPFFRITDNLTDGVAGTGIGLTIARELARLHGGDLTLLPTETGACFEVTLLTPSPKDRPA